MIDKNTSLKLVYKFHEQRVQTTDIAVKCTLNSCLFYFLITLNDNLVSVEAMLTKYMPAANDSISI